MTGAVYREEHLPRRPALAIFMGVVWSVMVAFALIGLSRAELLREGPDDWTYDWRTLFFSPVADEARQDIAIILIDEQSMAEYDYLSPIDRGLVASLLRGLDQARPRAIGVDFIYDRKSEEAKTQTLIEAMRSVGAPLIIGAIDGRVKGYGEENLKFQEAFLSRAGLDAGHVFFAREEDKLKIGDQTVRFMGERSTSPPYRESFAKVLAGKAGVRVSEPATRYISWLLPPPGDDLFPLFRVPRHAPGSPPEIILPESWRAALKDRIVLIGGDFVDRDKHLTPLAIADGAKLPGVVVHAQILAQLIDGRSIYTMPWFDELLLLIAVAFLGFLLSLRWRIKRFGWQLYLGGLVALIGLGSILFVFFNIIAPSTTLFFAWTFGVTGGHYAPRILQRVHSAA
jgi:CHASE2 domain-containing sensor protein